MQAIIFADRRGNELAPLCDDISPALLPVANLPLLQHAIEDVAAAGITDILLVVADHQQQIETHCGTGELWGVSLRYLLSRGEEDTTAVLARSAALLQPPFVALRGDIYRSPCVSAFLQACDEHPGEVVWARAERINAGLCLVREHDARLSALNWYQAGSTAPDDWLVLPAGRCAAIDSLAQLFSLNMESLSDAIDDAGVPGWQLAPGVKTGRQCRISPDSRIEAPALIGEQCHIAPLARLSGGCLIGKGCVIDRGAHLHRALVMPGTYVGAEQHLDHAIVSGSWLIPMATMQPRRIEDPAQQTDMEQETRGLLQRAPEQLLATLLLLLSLPLWPLALVLALWNKPRQPLSARFITHNSNGEHRLMAARVFATSVPLLSGLPLLWLVVTGQLNLFGSSLGYRAPSGLTLPVAAPGLLSADVLYLASDAPPEEVMLADIEFATERGAALLLRRLGRAALVLCSTRPWCRHTRGLDYA